MKRLKIIILFIISMILIIMCRNKVEAYPGDGPYSSISYWTGGTGAIYYTINANTAQNCNNLYCVEQGDALKDQVVSDWTKAYHYTGRAKMTGDTVKFYEIDKYGDVTDSYERTRNEADYMIAAILSYGSDLGLWSSGSSYTTSQKALFEYWNTWVSNSASGYFPSGGGWESGAWQYESAASSYAYDVDIRLFTPANNSGYQNVILVHRNGYSTRVPPTTDITVSKVWDDNSNAYGNRPSKVYFDIYNSDWALEQSGVELTGTGNTWSKTITVPSGTEYYAVESTQTGYNTPNTNGVQVTNSLATTSVTVTKVWDDDSNRDGKRANATVTLYETINGTKTASKDASGNVRRATLGTSNNSTATFSNLPTHRGGNAITYTVDETSVPTGYTKSVNGATITNTHIPERISISVKKVWDDVSNKENTRPQNIQIVLKNGNTTVQTKTLSGTGKEWTTTFENLYKYENGREINYTVEEVGVPESTKECAVSVTITGSKSSGFTVTNKFVPKTEYNVYKRWNDDNNRDGLRPTEIEVTLYADGVKVSKDGDGNSITNPIKIKPNSAGEWKYKFENLLKYNSNEELIVYSVQEKVPSRYEVEIITN